MNRKENMWELSNPSPTCPRQKLGEKQGETIFFSDLWHNSGCMHSGSQEFKINMLNVIIVSSNVNYSNQLPPLSPTLHGENKIKLKQRDSLDWSPTMYWQYIWTNNLFSWYLSFLFCKMWIITRWLLSNDFLDVVTEVGLEMESINKC